MAKTLHDQRVDYRERTKTLTPAGRALAENLVGLTLGVGLVIWLVTSLLPRIGEDPFLRLLIGRSDPFIDMGTAQIIALTFARSTLVVAVALALATVLGIAGAVAYSRSRRPLVRGFAWTLGTAGVSLPPFFWAMLLQLLVIAVYVRTGHRLFPTYGTNLEHAVLPALALAAAPAAYVFRLSALALLDAQRADYSTTARSKGLGEMVVLLRHQIPNSQPAILASIVLAAGGIVSSLAIIEYISGWQGAGFAFIHSLAIGRYEVAAGLFVLFSVSLGLLAIAVQVRDHLGDPRLGRVQ